jgi:glycosyltransferase involved in cell wall biosynthesis
MALVRNGHGVSEVLRARFRIDQAMGARSIGRAYHTSERTMTRSSAQTGYPQRLTLFISIVIPVFRDPAALEGTLAATDFAGEDVIVAATPDDVTLRPLRLAHPDLLWIEAERGRGRQMNAGAAIARGRWLVFLHADTRLPRDWRLAIEAADADRRVCAGCFRFALDSPSPFARAIELGVRLRVFLFGRQRRRRRHLGPGAALGGYADVPIMEDVDLVRRLRRRGRLFRSTMPAVTSARRWERDGWVRRTARHLALILLYFAGVSPERLVRLDRARLEHPAPPEGRLSL